MTIYSIHDLLVRELRDLYRAKQGQITSLPGMTSTSTTPLTAASLREPVGSTAMVRAEKAPIRLQ